MAAKHTYTSPRSYGSLDEEVQYRLFCNLWIGDFGNQWPTPNYVLMDYCLNAGHRITHFGQTYRQHRFGCFAGLIRAGFLVKFLRYSGLSINIHTYINNSICYQHLGCVRGWVAYLAIAILYSFTPFFPFFMSLSLPHFVSGSSFFLLSISFSVGISLSCLFSIFISLLVFFPFSIPLPVFDSSFVSILFSLLVSALDFISLFAMFLLTAVVLLRALLVPFFLPIFMSTLMLFGLVWVLLVLAPTALCNFSLLLQVIQIQSVRVLY